MKLYLFFTLLCLSFLLSCTNYSSTRNYRQFNKEECSSNKERRTSTISELVEIDSNNASNYRLSGTCTRDNSEIKVYIEGHPIDKKPLCQRGEWEVFANISGIINKKERIQVAISQAGNNDLLCENTQNFFICPDGYIGVSQLEPYTSKDFCVMKYEAKTSKDLSYNSYNFPVIKAESKAKSNLITGIRATLSTAIKSCKENGAGYDLIHNDHWQTIARSIEMVDVNWSSGNIKIEGGNRLNIGNTSSITSESNKHDINDKKWSEHKRYHKLLNGEYIWDFSGNLAEIVQHDITGLPVSYSGYVYNIPYQLKELFGPDRDYTILDARERSSGFAGLGFINGNRFLGGLLRGGGIGRLKTGIFSADTSVQIDRVSPSRTGFRCIYHP